MDEEALFRSELPLVERVITLICRRNCCYGDEADDFGSTVKLKLIEDDYAILRRFEGRSSLSTYLTTVIQNFFWDYRIAKWGRWRPSAKARRLGEVAVQLETLVSRDGFGTDEAIEILRSNHGVGATRVELLALAAKLPHRVQRKFEGEETIEQLSDSHRAERRAIDIETAQRAARAEAAVADAMLEIDPEDRLFLQMRYQDGFTVAQIARRHGLQQRSLYTRFENCMRSLREAMEERGVSAEDIREVVSWDLLDLKIDYGVEDDSDGEHSGVSV